MPDNKEEIRLDRSNEAAGEPLMPGDNTIKPSDTPANFSGVDSPSKNNLTQNATDPREGGPDFADEEDDKATNEASENG